MLVVTLPVSAAKNPRSFALRAKKAGAQVLEIRGDLTPSVRSFSSPIPVLLSPRGTALHLPSQYLDLERGEKRDIPRRTKIIRSFHDYDKTPGLARLNAVAESLNTSKPWAVKIATTVQTERDLVTLIRLSDWLKRKKVRGIVLGMGPKAHLTRVLSPLRNALTYASLDGFETSASGQLPLSFYALLHGRRKPKIFGILGGPHVEHSLSPVIHNALFSRHRIDAVYSCFPSTDFAATVKALASIGVTGYSVTAPFKHDAFTLASKREKLAETLGVANTLKRSGKKYHAWITDEAGIEHGYPVLASAKSVAILGAGGAVPSAITAIRRLHRKADITVYARDPKKATKDLKRFKVAVRPLHDAPSASVDVVICAVSQDVLLPLPRAKTAIDFRYGYTSRFLQDAKKKGMKTFDGVLMLIHQALKQFRHFTAKSPHARDAEVLDSVLRGFLPR
jgi:shikimate dehydrogenase